MCEFKFRSLAPSVTKRGRGGERERELRVIIDCHSFLTLHLHLLIDMSPVSLH